MTSKEGSIEVLFTEVWNSHDIERVVSLYAPDYEGIDVASAEADRGLDDLRRTVQRYLNAFPDLQISLEEVVKHEDRVAVSWKATGTHRGRFMNIPATGRVVTVRGISMLTLRDGKIWRGVHVWDVAGLLRGVRLLPELGA